MQHSKQECAHFCSEWNTVGYGNDVLSDMREWSSKSDQFAYMSMHCIFLQLHFKGIICYAVKHPADRRPLNPSYLRFGDMGPQTCHRDSRRCPGTNHQRHQHPPCWFDSDYRITRTVSCNRHVAVQPLKLWSREFRKSATSLFRCYWWVRLFIVITLCRIQ